MIPNMYDWPNYNITISAGRGWVYEPKDTLTLQAYHPQWGMVIGERTLPSEEALAFSDFLLERGRTHEACHIQYQSGHFPTLEPKFYLVAGITTNMLNFLRKREDQCEVFCFHHLQKWVEEKHLWRRIRSLPISFYGSLDSIFIDHYQWNLTHIEIDPEIFPKDLWENLLIPENP